MNRGTMTSDVATTAAGAWRELLVGVPVRERRIEIAGFSTALLEGGTGTPVVLLHGPGQYAAKWFVNLPALVRDYHVIAPDLPGHGETVLTDGAVTAGQVLEWLDDFIDSTCDTPPVIVGHVIGGAIAMRYAATHADRIRQLILVDTLGLAPFQPEPEFAHALMSFVTQPGEATHDALWEGCAYDLGKLRTKLGARWEAMKTYNIDRALVPELQQQQQALMQEFGFAPVAQAELAAIRTPTHVIWGRHDRATPLAVAQSAAQRYGWTLAIIEGANDDPAIEQPEAFAKVLRQVISG